MYKKINQPWEFNFNVSEAGAYAIRISATCQNGKLLGLFGGQDLRVEIDELKLREVPSGNKPKYFDIPSTWNGSNLKRTEKIIVFILKLTEGVHTIKFIPKRGAEILNEPQISKLDSNSSLSVLKDVQSLEKDRQSWVTVVTVDFPINFLDVEVTCKKRDAFDSDDVKLVIDGEIQKNSNPTWWGKNWFWQGKDLQGKTQSNRFYLGLAKGIHYIELWADRKPFLNKLDLNIFENNDNQDEKNNIPVGPYENKGPLGNSDYNRYDGIIEEVVNKWNEEFLRDKYPVEKPLDPNLVKAIIYRESKMGYYPGGEINVMQVGNPGDPSLKTLNGELAEYWMQNGIEKKLDYNGKANADTPYESIYWGVRWLYHKAQGINGGKRYWKNWKEAVQAYGPGPAEYADNIWLIYTEGLDKSDSKKSIKLWSFIFVAPLIFGLHGFFNNPEKIVDQNSFIKNKILNENTANSVELNNVEVIFSESDPKLFFAILEWEKDWWENLKIGRLENDKSIRWLAIDNPIKQQYILSAKFIYLKGFADPILEIYGKTHVGNGSLYLYKITGNRAELLLETRAVDSKNELSTSPDNYKQYGYWQCDEVFRDGQLKSEYADMNKDGVAEVVLNGVSEVICQDDSGIEKKEIVVRIKEIEKLFSWDGKKYAEIER
jgi:hypothetical protein